MCFTFFELNWKKNTLNESPSEWSLDVPDTGCTFTWDQIRTTLVLKVNSINRNKRQISFSASLKKKKRFCQTSTKFCKAFFPPRPNLMPRDRGCAFLCLKQAFHWTGLKKSHFVKNYLHYFGVQTKLFVWDMCHTSLALSKSPNIINLIITLSSDILSTNSDILSQ